MMRWKTPSASRRANIGMNSYLPEQILSTNLFSYQRPPAASSVTMFFENRRIRCHRCPHGPVIEEFETTKPIYLTLAMHVEKLNRLWGNRISKSSFKNLTTSSKVIFELGFKLVAQSHHLIHLFRESVLLREGREWECIAGGALTG